MSIGCPVKAESPMDRHFKPSWAKEILKQDKVVAIMHQSMCRAVSIGMILRNMELFNIDIALLEKCE